MLTFVPPLALTALEAVAHRFSPRVQRGLHLVFVAALVAVLAAQAVQSVASRAIVPIALAMLIGTVAAVAYARTRLVPAVLTVLAPAPLVFVAIFLFVSPVSKLVFDSPDTAAADVAIGADTPVVVVVFDELAGLTLMGPDRRIDAARLPAFARLARDATWYRNATSVADFTDRAVPAILSGNRPERNSLPIASEHPHNLFTLLGRGHDLQVSEPVTDLCPAKLCPQETADRAPQGRRLRDLGSDLWVVSKHLLLPDELRRDLPPIDRSFGGFGDDAVDGDADFAGGQEGGQAAFSALRQREPQFESFVRGLGRPARRPALSFLHVAFPHNPYDHLPDGRRYSGEIAGLDGGEEKPGGTWRDDPALVRQGLERYLLQVGYTDQLLGRLLHRLRRAGLYDRALVVVTADHGVSFVPGVAARAVELANFAGIAGVPLLVKAPGQRRGRVDDRNVSTIDALPTVASLLKARLPWDVDGVVAGRRSPGVAVEMQPRLSQGEVTMPFPAFVRQRDATVRRMAAEFRLGRRFPRPRLVPDADLVGRPVDAVARVRSPTDRVELDDEKALRSVDPRGPTLPLVVSGRLSGHEAGERLAIGIGGTVATVVRPFERGGDWRFNALVPPERLRRGVNRLSVVRVTGRGAGRRLELLGSGDVDARLVRDGSTEVIIDRGRRIPIRPGVEGRVDRVGGGGGLVVLEGWAADTTSRRRAARVIAFSGDRFVGAAVPSIARPDLAKAYGGWAAKSGFSVGGAAGPRVRVFAVLDGRASLLPGATAP